MIVKTLIKVTPESPEEDTLIKKYSYIIEDEPAITICSRGYPVYIVTEDQLKKIQSKLLSVRGNMG